MESDDHHGQSKDPQQAFEIEGAAETHSGTNRVWGVTLANRLLDLFPSRAGRHRTNHKHCQHSPEGDVGLDGGIGEPRGQVDEPDSGGERPDARNEAEIAGAPHPGNEERRRLGIAHRVANIPWHQELLSEPRRSEGDMQDQRHFGHAPIVPGTCPPMRPCTTTQSGSALAAPRIPGMVNRLAQSTSPYLLQHKNNPVDWWEWGEHAFSEAAARDIPVLLSVGYSACHWCHVMAHESFEDEETADLMNQNFVNIKVDREERPDVDSIYMEAVQTMTGRGGWPMTVWMTPDGRPFYAGTYFPKDRHSGMPAFSEVMAAVADAWATNRNQVLQQADNLVSAIASDIPAGDFPDATVLDDAVSTILESFDPINGGFGGAPKFPQQPVLEFLLRSRASDPAIDGALSTTLTRMADGGIHDHLAGGFARYSVDPIWLVPHFEKMLYDNAQLARIYLWAGVELDEPRFVEVAKMTLDYLLNDLRHPTGGFYSAEDADSEGVEGKFYVWELDEFEEVVGEDSAKAAEYFGVSAHGNFEGANILNLGSGGSSPDNLQSIRERLLQRRSQRIRPGLDDKVVASWNGLAIRAFAETGAALKDAGYLEAATGAADFILENLVSDGRLMRSWREGQVSVPAFVDDYASMALGLFALYQATGEVRWYQSAEKMVDSLDQFQNPEGGFYTTSADSETLIKRPVDITDNPSPSGSALAAEALLVSALFTGDLDRRDAALKTVSTVGRLADRYPSMIGHHLSVARSIRIGTKELAIVGGDATSLVDAYWSSFRPHVVLAQSPAPMETVPLLAGRTPSQAAALAYVCEGFSCNMPTSSPSEVIQQLS